MTGTTLAVLLSMRIGHLSFVKLSLIFALTLRIFSSSAGGEGAKTNQRFSDQDLIEMSKNWQFDCHLSSAQQSNDILRQAAESALNEGYHKIFEINPLFANEIARRIQIYQPELKFSCELTTAVSGYVGNSIFFSQDVFEFYASDLASRGFQTLIGSGVHAVLFHEILHSVRAESLTADHHNDISWSEDRKLRAESEGDSVIACSSLVERESKSSRSALCKICAASQFQRSSFKINNVDSPLVKISPLLAEKAKAICQLKYGTSP